MPAKDFKFISPGVFINEIDNSQLPASPGTIGPVIIGRAKSGPALKPTKVDSFSDFVQKFGTPTAGSTNDDISRNGNSLGPAYGSYAAQAWLRNNSPITYVRLVGKEHTKATTAGKAGWSTDNGNPTFGASQGGAYGLFVLSSGSYGKHLGNNNTGSLAAIFYLNSGSVALTGTCYSSSAGALTADGNAVKSNSWFGATSAGQFKAVIKTEDGVVTNTKFDFSSTSQNFIRKVFNTNPTLSNGDITDTTGEAYTNYWLGASYEDEINASVLTGTVSSEQYACIVPLFATSYPYSDKRRDYSDPKSGWIISQDLTTNTGSFDAADMQKLFRLVGLNTGRWASRNVKASIQDIRVSEDDANQYGSFTVAIRKMSDTDNRPVILEQFNNCNLNPNSENYIARKIGDKYSTWDDTDRRYRDYGNFNNNSDYIYVEMNSDVDEGKTDPSYLPFGCFGPPRFSSFSTSDSTVTTLMVTGGMDYYGDGAFELDGKGMIVSSSQANYPIRLEFPKLRLRVSASEGNPTDPREVWFGVDTTFNRQGRASKTIGEYTGPKPAGIDNYLASSDNPTTTAMWVFTLDDMCNSEQTSLSLSGTNVYVSGSRQSTSVRGYLQYINSGSYKDVLNNGANKFTTVLHGGFDGLDNQESEPFRNSQWSSDSSELNSATFNSMKIAIDSLRDPEVVEFDLAAMPGITNNVLNRNIIDMCETRGDALAIIDLKDGYVPETENTQSIANRLGSVAATITNKKNNLQINSSFGAAYYPWVQIQDTINGQMLWAPPSVAALGAMSYGQATQALWFAPAGFTRGGLSVNNAAGIPVTGVRERLVSRDRDKLYDANINPIAQFPAEGIVIFGQKTLQATASALDRINVRRLLIFLKRQISKIAATLLFDQNVQSTWNRFRGRVEPLLASVKAGLGLQDYKLLLDETTTTPDLIDRNIMYAKILLKPTRAIEFIAIDFVITDSGASFED